jgi:SNF2 family DNA or RNA helicase
MKLKRCYGVCQRELFGQFWIERLSFQRQTTGWCEALNSEALSPRTTTRRYNFVRLDGGTSQAQRQPLVDKFNHEPNVFLFLISTKAGGLGLNLTAANKVVVFDPCWNPAQDLQAQDRAFRLGQQRHVAVYRLIALGTLEENIYERQVYKQQQV